MTDPLAQYRRKAPTAEIALEPSTPGKGKREPYVAFDTKDRVKALDIRRADGIGHAPSYNYLLDVSYGRRFYTSFVLMFSFMVVTVKGRNLEPVVQALKLRTCQFIEEYSAEDFDPPGQEQPVIESIEISVKEPGAR